MDNIDQNNGAQIESTVTASSEIIKPRFTFWTGVIVALALIGAQLIAGILAAIIAGVAFGFEAENYMDVVMGITLIIAFPLAVWIVLRKRDLEPVAWNWNSKFWMLLPVSFVMVYSMSYVTGTLMELLPNYEDMVAQYADMFSSLNKEMLLIGGGIIGPICEEVIFRGIILAGLLKTYEYKKAILFSAIIFSVIHMVPIQMISTFFIGIILGYIYYKTRSLWIVIIIHVVNNMIAFFIGTENIDPTDTFRLWFNNDLLFFGSLVLALIMVFVAYKLFEKIYNVPDLETTIV